MLTEMISVSLYVNGVCTLTVIYIFLRFQTNWYQVLLLLIFINTYFRITIVTLNYSITKIKPIPKVGATLFI